MTTWQKQIGWSVISVLSLLLMGCLGGPVNMPPLSSYTLTGPMKPIPTRSRSSQTLLMTTTYAAPGYQTAAMVYTATPYNLQHFAKNRWVAPPSMLLSPIFANRVRAYGYFKAVVTPPFSGNANYRLDTRLEVLRQEFMRPTSQIRMIVQATVINSDNLMVLGAQHFQVVLNAPGNDPYAGVLASNRAANIIAGKLARFVVSVVRRDASRQRQANKKQPVKQKVAKQEPVKKPILFAKLLHQQSVKRLVKHSAKRHRAVFKYALSLDPPAVPVIMPGTREMIQSNARAPHVSLPMPN